MELRTLVLDGVEYVLIPKETFERIIGVSEELPTSEAPNTEPESDQELTDFDVAPQPRPLPLASDEEKKASIKVVDVMPEIKKAQGAAYGYAERLKNRALVPEDVMVAKPSFTPMEETPEIAKNDFKDKFAVLKSSAKFGFYGEGAVRDVG